MCRVIRLWCTLIFTALAVGIYTDVGHGMEDAAPVAHEWDIGVHSDPINRNAVNVPAQPCRLGEPENVSGISEPDEAALASVRESYGKLPLYFIHNDQGCKIEQLSPIKLQNVEIEGTICAKYGEITNMIIENKGKIVEIRKAR